MNIVFDRSADISGLLSQDLLIETLSVGERHLAGFVGLVLIRTICRLVRVRRSRVSQDVTVVDGLSLVLRRIPLQFGIEDIGNDVGDGFIPWYGRGRRQDESGNRGLQRWTARRQQSSEKINDKKQREQVLRLIVSCSKQLALRRGKSHAGQ